MKKTTLILLLILQIFLLFIFQNIHSVFKTLEDTDLVKIRNPVKLKHNIVQIRKMFTFISVVTAMTLLGTGVYLGVLLKRTKVKSDYNQLPPLHNYLLELKGSETKLKYMVQQQQVTAQEKEELSKTIINSINAAMVFLNRSGRIEIFNAQAQEMFSQSYANARNNLPRGVFAGFPGVLAFIESCKEGHGSGEVVEGERVFYVDIAPVESIGRLLLVRDITEEKRREEIQRRNGNFIMLGEMAAFLAHEIKNSLGVIYGYTRTIKENDEKTAKITREIDFLTGMMEGFLNFSNPVKVTHKKKVELAPMLEQISGESGISVVSDASGMGEKPVVLESDPMLLRSVFSNLLINSREAGADRVEVVFSDPGDGLELRVRDNGGGIAPENREKIWYPFFTTREKGSGMGLAIIRKIINTLGGEIELRESTGSGTEFGIRFYG